MKDQIDHIYRVFQTPHFFILLCIIGRHCFRNRRVNYVSILSCRQEASNTVDAAKEKHVPVATYYAAKNDVHVQVGSVPHPMTEEHLITCVILVTKKGVQRVNLTAADAPEATFRLADGDAPVKVLEYCNLHGLWQADL